MRRPPYENDRRTEADYRQTVISRYLPALLKLASHKGTQYAGGAKPALINFYEGSGLVSDTPEHYLMTLATKQWHVISDWAKTEGDNSRHMDIPRREIIQRIFDVIVYMMLLLFMVEVLEDQALPGDEK